MTDRRTDIIIELEKGLEATTGLFQSFTPKELDIQVYDDEPYWTVKQVLAHFITIESSMQWLFNNMLAGGPDSPEDFDVDRFNRTQPRKLDGLALDALIRQYRTVRQDTISIVRQMSESDLDRQGRHPFHGQDSLERFIRWAYEHVSLHEQDIREKVGKP